MVIDCHVHTCAFTPGRGAMSASLEHSLPFRFMRWRLGVKGREGRAKEESLESVLAGTLTETTEIDAAVLLAFDAVHDDAGNIDLPNTHLYVTNDYALDLSKRLPKLLFGCSVHPHRKDAVAELERCIANGAVLMKWLPITQAFNPADERCFPLYEVLAHHKVPLLSHTGGEQSLPQPRKDVADPALLKPALERGVTVIAAHCGTRSRPGETDFVPTFVRMAKEYENLYGDTAALNLPTRNYAYEAILNDDAVRRKLVHGSDWPIIAVPPLTRVGLRETVHLLRDRNWLRRDVRIKQACGFDDAYWQRAGTILRLEK